MDPQSGVGRHPYFHINATAPAIIPSMGPTHHLSLPSQLPLAVSPSLASIDVGSQSSVWWGP